MYKTQVTISRFICTKCNNEGIPLPRFIGKQREKNHLKNIYCIHCKEKHNHVEIRAFDNVSV